MIYKIICDSESENNYKLLSGDRKLKYQEIWKKIACHPEEYIISVDVASPNIKDQSCVIKYSYEEWLKGNKVVESIDYF